MENDANNAATPNTPLVTGPAAAATVVNAQVLRPEPIRNPRKSERIKKIAWRVTATGYWLWWIIGVFLGSEFLNRFSSAMTTRLVGFLTSVGFAPSHSEHLPKILRFGWLLTIVGFKPFELLGLVIYICAAP